MISVGVGFIAILTAAFAQRFLAADVQALEAEVADESSSLDLILGELGAVRERLGELETPVQRISAR